MVELPTPSDWLDVQLDKRGWSQNEFARQAGIAQSAVSRFRRGVCGCETAVDIANGFDVPPRVTLALLGRVAPPASMESIEAETLATIFTSLDESGQAMLLSYAEHLRTQQRRLS